MFFVPISQQIWSPRALICRHILDISSVTAAQNFMKPYRKQVLKVLYQVCVFRADRSTNMAAEGSDWLRHFRHLLCNHCTEFQETLQEASTQCPLPSVCFSCRSVNKYGRQGLWLADTFSKTPLQLLQRISRNPTGSKYSRSSTKLVFFVLNGQQQLRGC